MKALRLLGLPWMAWSKDARENIALLMAAIATIAGIVVVCIAVSDHSYATLSQLAIGFLAVVDVALWWLGLSQAMLLARSAHRLRLPTLVRDVRASLASYALLTIVLPAIMLSWLGGKGTEALIWLALGAGFGLGMATLPNWMAAWMWVAYLLAKYLFAEQHAFARWLPVMPRLVLNPMAWVATTVCILWLLNVFCWRRAVIHEHALSGVNQPALWFGRARSWYGRDHVDSDTETRRLSRRLRWWQYAIDLRGSGPYHPIASLRVALGGWTMPQTPVSWIRRLFALAVAAGLFVVYLIIIATNGQPTFSSFDSHWLFWLFAACISPVIAQTSTKNLQHRWNRASAELTLLALLPGLNTRMPARRALLRACLLPSFVAQCMLLTATLGVAMWMHNPTSILAELALANLSGMAMLLALTLTTLGGTLIETGEYLLYWIGFFTAAIITAVSVSTSDMPSTPAAAVYVTIAAFWFFLSVPLLLVARSGWRRFQRRPHPFLANV